MITMLLVIALIGFLALLICQIPMLTPFKNIITIVAIIFAILYVINNLSVLGLPAGLN